MSALVHRRDSLAGVTGSYLAPDSGYFVNVYPQAGVVNGNQSGTTITLYQGHGIPAAGGKVARFSAGLYISGSYVTASSSTGTTVVLPGSQTVLDGDLFVYLGADTGSSTPNWDASTQSIYSVPNTTTPITASKVTADSGGEFKYWIRDVAHTLIVRSGTTVLDVKQVTRVNDDGFVHVNDFATGGQGTSADPWTGWGAAVADATNIYFPGGYYSISTIALGISATNAASKTTIKGDGSGSTFITITSATGQFRVYGTTGSPPVLQSVEVRGLMILAGANNTSAAIFSFENGDIGCIVDDILVDPTASFYITVGIQLLNCENMRVGMISVRGRSSVDAAAGNVRTGVLYYTNDGIQRGNIGTDYCFVTNATTGLSLSSTGGSYANLRFGICKLVNSTLVDGTQAVTTGTNSEQVSFLDLHMEKFNNGLLDNNSEQLMVHNGLASQIKNNAGNAGTAFSIINGDSGYINSRIDTCFNGIALSGTTTRYFVCKGTAGTITGTYFADTSSGQNTYFTGNAFAGPFSISTGLFTASAGLAIEGRQAAGNISASAITITNGSNWTVDTTGGTAAFDTLATINGGTSGQIIVISAANDLRQVLVQNATGNIKLMGQGNRLLGNSIDTLTLQKVGSNWIELAYQSTRGDFNCNAEEITLSTSGLTTDSSANLLPVNSLIEAVTAYVTVTITTTTNWALGDGTTSNRFSSANGTLTAGTAIAGLNHRDPSVASAAGPQQTAAAKLRVTCTGANPGAGKIRVFVFYRQFYAPAA